MVKEGETPNKERNTTEIAVSFRVFAVINPNHDAPLWEGTGAETPATVISCCGVAPRAEDKALCIHREHRDGKGICRC